MRRPSIYLLAIACSAVFASHSPCFANSINTINKYDKVDIIYYGFYAESYSGVSISRLNEYGCKYRMNKSAFEDIISKSISTEYAFNTKNVRAKIINGSDEKYIDIRGVIKTDGKNIMIDRKKFEENLESYPESNCKN